MKYNITEEEFNKMEILDIGGFAVIYTDGVNVIKKWKERCPTNVPNCSTENPCLKLNRSNRKKYKRLNKIDSKLLYSDVAVDEVYLGGCHFIGLRQKRYDGETLEKFLDLTLEEKKDILLELIRNFEELTNNKIYSFDGKLNNVVFTKDRKVKIIDLNDALTKVTILKSPIKEEKAILNLKKIILSFLYYNHRDFDKSYDKYISSSVWEKFLKEKRTYDELRDWVKEFKWQERIIIVDFDDLENMDLELVKNYLIEGDLKLVLTLKRTYLSTHEKDFLEKIYSYGIVIYDMILCKEFDRNVNDYVDEYIKSHDFVEAYRYSNGEIIDINKHENEKIKVKRKVLAK